MGSMFYGNISFNQDIGSWDVSNVTDMSSMFGSAAAFNKDIGSWDTSSVNNMDGMFSPKNLFAYDLKMNFNQDLTKWCVSNISSEPQEFNKWSGIEGALTQANKPIWGTCPGNSYTIAVTASSNTNYTLSGKDRNGDVSGNDPGLTFKVGDEVTFSVNATGHPFYLKTVVGTGTDNQISGVTNNGATSGSVVWTPTAAGTYYYICSLHSGMVGTITIQN
jgi:surface protein